MSCLLALPILAVPLNAHAAARATLAVKPKKVLDGSSITVSATHLQPKHVFTFMLVGPKAKQDRRLLGWAQSDARGRITALLKMPVIVHCGKSNVYVIDSKHILAHATLTLTGCTLKGKPGAPPAAPGKS
jgi:hypothetical protein